MEDKVRERVAVLEMEVAALAQVIEDLKSLRNGKRMILRTLYGKLRSEENEQR